MDIKLRNYRFSNWFKLLSIIICVAGILTASYGFLKAPYFEYAFQNKDFKESGKIKDILFETYNVLSTVAIHYKNEEYIKSGKALDNEEINARTSFLLNNKETEIAQIETKYKDLINNYQGKDQQGINNLNEQKQTELEKINQKYIVLEDNIKSEYIKEQLADYRAKMDTLNNKEGIFFTVVENGKAIFSNAKGNKSTEDFYKELPFFTQITHDNYYNYFFNGSVSYALYDSQSFPADSAIYLGMSQEKYDAELDRFNQYSKDGMLGIKIFALGLIAFLIGLINIIYASGRRVDKDGIHLIAIDQIYLDVTLVISMGALLLCMAPIGQYGEHLFREDTYLNTNLLKIMFGVLLAIGTLIFVNFVSMLSKRLKRHEVIKHTLIFKICRWIILRFKIISLSLHRKLTSVFDNSPIALRLVLLFGVYAFVTLISILLFLRGSDGVFLGFAGLVAVNFTGIYFILKTFKAFKEIQKGAERIRCGELSYNIPEQGISELKQLSVTINSIADGLKNAVSSQVKAERMKTELITNVSHDLKTPLTSIINYVDLLKNEGLQSENAEKYLGVIDAKSQRLKALTEDPFETFHKFICAYI